MRGGPTLELPRALFAFAFSSIGSPKVSKRCACQATSYAHHDPRCVDFAQRAERPNRPQPFSPFGGIYVSLCGWADYEGRRPTNHSPLLHQLGVIDAIVSFHFSMLIFLEHVQVVTERNEYSARCTMAGPGAPSLPLFAIFAIDMVVTCPKCVRSFSLVLSLSLVGSRFKSLPGDCFARVWWRDVCERLRVFITWR